MNLFRFLLSVVLVMILAEPGSLAGSRWWRVYFTSPGGISRTTRNPETALVNFIDNSKEYFYGSFYDLTSQPVLRSLVRAGKRGVDVKLVLEKDNAQSDLIKGPVLSGVGMVLDTNPGLMHNKFAVIDGRYIWTGSYNPTTNGAYKNNNNAIIIYSELLSDIYRREFMEMYQLRVFGNKREPGPFSGLMKKYYVKVEDTAINAYFAPEDNIERILVKRIKKAKGSIYFMAFSFTSDTMSEAIITKHKQGLDVRGLFEKRGSGGKYSEYIKMKVEGLPVKTDRNRSIMHHKVIIIDKKRVITGSYNFTRNANRINDENVLIIDNEEIARYYIDEFNRLYR